tara:strand:+ start:807 stop:1157 length:351 start_codon:yes stop_codon:yes gene_type:complete
VSLFWSKQRHRKPKRIYKNSRNVQRRVIRWLLLLIASVLLIIFIFGDHGMYQLYRLRAERSANQALITELRKERGKLEEENFRLKTDMEYIERIARERYRMVKKGEKVFKVIPKEN